jgi:serine protease Do
MGATMRIWLGFASFIAATVAASAAACADYNTLHAVNAGPPTIVQPLPAGAKAQPVELVRVVIHPQDGGAWALEYGSIVVGDEDHPPPPPRLVSWNSGAADQKLPPFRRVLDEELHKAGFAAPAAESLFADGAAAADLKIAVLVTDMQGRFCRDCPNLFNRKAAPASVKMTAQWEIYSTLERKVIAKIDTEGAGDSQERLAGSYLPGVLEGFRENVRQLLASEQFRKTVMAKAEPQPNAAAASARVAAIALQGSGRIGGVGDAAKSVAIVYAADGQGSGFLVSSDGYVLTNQHVVGGSKYVKLKWAEGAETVGEVVRSDRRRDVALIKTTAPGRSPLALRPGPVQQGETVFAIGTPLDDKLQNTMTKGIVSAERIEDGQRLIQSDAGINHGNSGGPLIDDKGRVIAIAVSGLLPGSHQMGLNFFIPIDDALKVLMLTSGPVEGLAPASATAARIAKKR